MDLEAMSAQAEATAADAAAAADRVRREAEAAADRVRREAEAAAEWGRREAEAVRTEVLEVPRRVRAEVLGRVQEAYDRVMPYVDTVRDIIGIVGQVEQTIIDVRNGLVGAAEAFFALGGELTGATGRVGDHWIHQVEAWRKLYAATGNGRRLPVYDRTLRIWRVGGIGEDMRALVTGDLGGISAEARASAYRSVYRDAGGQPIRDEVSGWIMTAQPAAPREHWRRYIRSDGRLRVPEVPMDWAHLIPGVYRAFWAAPENADPSATLLAWERENYLRTFAQRASAAASRGGRFELPPEPGQGVIPIDWGPLVRLDQTPLIRDAAWVAAEYGPEATSVLGVQIETFAGSVTPDQYRQVMDALEQHASPEWRAAQLEIEAETNPRVAQAIELGARLRRGEGGAAAEVAALDPEAGALLAAALGDEAAEGSA